MIGGSQATEERPTIGLGESQKSNSVVVRHAQAAEAVPE